MPTNYEREYTKDEIREVLLDIVTSNTKKDKTRVTDRSNMFDDIKADSLDMVMMIMAAEEEFDIVIDEPAAESVETFGDFVNVVVHKLETLNRFMK